MLLRRALFATLLIAPLGCGGTSLYPPGDDATNSGSSASNGESDNGADSGASSPSGNSSGGSSDPGQPTTDAGSPIPFGDAGPTELDA